VTALKAATPMTLDLAEGQNDGPLWETGAALFITQPAATRSAAMIRKMSDSVANCGRY
jgi:hypothetical protein